MSEAIRNMDWKLLRKQKRSLVDVTSNGSSMTSKQKELLEGLINLIDAIQDEATEYLSEEIVFGKKEE